MSVNASIAFTNKEISTETKMVKFQIISDSCFVKTIVIMHSF